MDIVIYLIVLGVSFYAIVWSGKVLVSSLSFVSKFLGISEYTVSFILMALATSLPGFFVGISSAIAGRPNISFGNVVGANIINVTLAVALVAIFAKGIKITANDSRKDSFWAAVISIFPVFLALDGTISRFDGLILISIFIAHFVYLLKLGKDHGNVFNSLPSEQKTLKNAFKNLFAFAYSVLILLGGGWAIIWASIKITAMFNLPLFVIGLVLVSIGTTLPEITFGLRSVLSGKDSMAFGNILGSTVTNSALILGVVSLISPIHIIDFNIAITGLLMMTLSVCLFALIIRYKKALTYKDGIFLLFLYVVFLLLEFLLK